MSDTARSLDTGWCTFQVATGLYGVELDRVHEVLRPQPLTAVPLAPPAVVGLLNLRGRIVPAVDLRVLFGLPRLAEGQGGMVVVQASDGPVALLVDSIGDVQRHASLAPHEAAARTHAAPESLCAYTLPLPQSLLVVLELDQILSKAFERPGRGAPARSRLPSPRFPGD